MSEDRELLQRISQLSGQINLHRAHLPSSIALSQRQNDGQNIPTSTWDRGHQSHRARGRGGRIATTSHRHRTLVLKKSNNKSENIPLSSSNSAQNEMEPASKSNFVSKHDRHMQLINTSIYDKDAESRRKAIEETRKQKALRRDVREKQKIKRHLQNVVPRNRSSITDTAHEIVLDGLRFHIVNGGSKLARVRGALDSSSLTPKEATIGGVKFHRSKNGNLYRSGVVKAKKWDERDSHTGITDGNRNTGAVAKRKELCKRFTLSGQCYKGPQCPFTHDPTKVTICKTYLQTGSCPLGDACDLSHEATPERVPVCLHFLRGNCSNPSCRYSHVRVTPSAPVCKAFATLGYCDQGADCSERHVHECPSYANTGACSDRKCRLPHVDRAGQIRKQAAAGQAGRGMSSGDDDDSDLVSDDQADSDDNDVDSDDMEYIMDAADDAASHAISEQHDFIHF